jgi:hypothetical protein
MSAPLKGRLLLHKGKGAVVKTIDFQGESE